MNKKDLKLLYRSFEVELDPKERKRLKEALNNNPELRKMRKEIVSQRQKIAESVSPSFSFFFAEKVMNRFVSERKEKNSTEYFYEILKRVFRPVAIASAVILLILITFNLKIGDNIAVEEVFYSTDTTYSELEKMPLF